MAQQNLQLIVRADHSTYYCKLPEIEVLACRIYTYVHDFPERQTVRASHER